MLLKECILTVKDKLRKENVPAQRIVKMRREEERKKRSPGPRREDFCCRS
jgi:hypothetical protein